MSASPVAVRLAELQGWTDIHLVPSHIGNFTMGKPLNCRYWEEVPEPDTDAGDAWRLVCWLTTESIGVVIGPSSVVLNLR